MAEKELFWIGKGSVLIGGKPWNKKQPLPLNKLSKEFLNKMVKMGKIGEKIGTSETITANAQDEIKTLNSVIDKLTKENKELKSDIEKSSSDKEKSLKAKVKDLEAENKELKELLESSSDDQGKLNLGDGQK